MVREQLCSCIEHHDLHFVVQFRLGPKCEFEGLDCALTSFEGSVS